MHERFPDLARPPRPVPWTLAAGVMLHASFIAGALVTGLGLCVFWPLAGPSFVEFRFLAAGRLEPVRGTLLGTERTAYSVGGGKGRPGTPVFRYSFRFTDATGEPREGESYTTGDRLRGNAFVDVEYDPARPAICRIVDTRASPFGLAVLFVGIIPAVGLPFLITGVRTGLRARRLLAEGKVAGGRIVSRKPTNVQVNKQPVIDFEVEFATFSGKKVVFHHKTHVTRDLGDEAEEPVFYDPMRPEDAVLADALPARAQVGPDGHWQPAATVSPVIGFAALCLPLVAQALLAAWMFL